MQTHAGELYFVGPNGALLKDENNKWSDVLNSLAHICEPFL